MDEERRKLKEYFDSVEMTEEYRQRLLDLAADPVSPKAGAARKSWKPLAAAAVLVLVSLAGIPLLKQKARLPSDGPSTAPEAVSSESDTSPEASDPIDTEQAIVPEASDPPESTAAPTLPSPPSPPDEATSEPATTSSDPSTEPSESDAEPTLPITPVVEPTAPVVGHSEPVTEPTAPIEPVTEPTDPVTEPSDPVTEPIEPVTEPIEPVTEPNPIESDIIETFPVPGGPAIETDVPMDPIPLDWPAEYVVENGRSLLRVTHPDTGALWELDITDEMNDNVYNGDEIIFGQEVLISLYVFETGEYDLLLLPWQQP